jgi:PAS domain S-box-containing protein
LLGDNDTPDRLLIPEKLYGRAREIETVLASFDRIIKGGVPEMVLVSGYSGIGKSSVVNELHKVLVPPRGLLGCGKFDQYKRDIPCSSLVQAFQSLVRPLLGKSDSELASWRSAFLEALEPNAALMADLIPDLKLIIGDQPPIPEFEPQQAQGRFQLVFRRFIGVFARPEHPLALFLDDLQWLDGATLDLLEDLLTRSDLQHLMLIGAYRDNEVDAAHPLALKLEAIKNAGAKIEEITLAPLGRQHIEQLIMDAFHCGLERARPLAQVVLEKTAGNPLFMNQFLHALADGRLLRFDYDAVCWSWDLDGIHAMGYTDNVVDLMVDKLARLPAETQHALQILACLGNVFAVAMLSTVLGTSLEQAHAVLWPAIRQELVERRDGSYKFVHDRVQEAAYSQIPEASRAEVHLRIGRMLEMHTPPEKREEAIFEIVGQLNRGAALIADQKERDQLGEFNLVAGKRAKESTDYASALSYLNTGSALLAQDCWERKHELTFALELNQAECEFLTGQLSVAEERLELLSNRATTTIEQAVVACLRMDVYTALDRSDRAVAVSLEYLRYVGIVWSPHPQDEELRREYDFIRSRLEGRTIEELIDLPPIDDLASLATIDVLSKLMSPAWFTDANLASLTMCKAASLSLVHGNCDASCFAYVMLGKIARAHFGDYNVGLRFGQLGYDLVERRGLKRAAASTYLCFAVFIAFWMKDVGTCRDVLRRAFEAGNQIGDLLYASYTCNTINSHLLFSGEPLPDLQEEAEHGLAFAKKARFGIVIEAVTTQLALVRMLRGLTPIFGSFDDTDFNELRTECVFSDNPSLAWAACFYMIRKMQARFFAGDYTTALDAARKAQPLLWTVSSLFEEAEYHFFGALTQAGCCSSVPISQRQEYMEALTAHQRHLETWAENCPQNFENRAALVRAEIARLEDRTLDAEHLYEHAIRSARANGFTHIEALANELAFRFYAARGFDKIARVYLQDARYGYLRWGADGKVRQLEGMHPHLRPEEPVPEATKTIATPIDYLDLATVIKVSQAVSGEIVLEKMIDTLMRLAIEQAGADRGLLILLREGGQRITAEAKITGDTVSVHLRDEAANGAMLPQSVLQYVLRTRESVILDDAAAQSTFAEDPYIHERHARSVLCLPLISQTKLTGLLYLENNLARCVFVPARTAVLKLLASQAAIALENASLYRDVERREAKIGRLVEANIIGIFIRALESSPDGPIVEANDAFLRLVGYDREDLVSRRIRWAELSPPEWHDRDVQAVAELAATGTVRPYEKEYLRKDGRRVPVLVGAASLEQEAYVVAFVLDLTERKRAEAEARESERRYHEVQMQLAHANRVATMGQLTASIAHEVNQPIAAAVANAQTGLRWLGAEPPNLDEARLALGRVLRDGQRASEVIGRIRTLIKKARRTDEGVDINAAIREVIELTRSEASKNSVRVQAELVDGLPLVRGDRVELQQVILNLMVNAVEAMNELTEGPRDLLLATNETESGRVIVAVSDSGPGLVPDAMEHLFKAFHTTKPDGLGLGLSICRWIIEAHGGELWARANAPRGAVFQFTLSAYPEIVSGQK